MRASRFSASGSFVIRFLPAALFAIACSESTTPATATKLEFSALPGNVIAAKPIAPSVVVTIQDANGRKVSGATTSVTLSIGPNSPAGTLAGTTTVAATDGVAVFPNISIDKAGNGYTLRSVGENMKDDGGQGDDLVVNLP